MASQSRRCKESHCKESEWLSLSLWKLQPLVSWSPWIIFTPAVKFTWNLEILESVTVLMMEFKCKIWEENVRTPSSSFTLLIIIMLSPSAVLGHYKEAVSPPPSPLALKRCYEVGAHSGGRWCTLSSLQLTNETTEPKRCRMTCPSFYNCLRSESGWNSDFTLFF